MITKKSILVRWKFLFPLSLAVVLLDVVFILTTSSNVKIIFIAALIGLLAVLVIFVIGKRIIKQNM